MRKHILFFIAAAVLSVPLYPYLFQGDATSQLDETVSFITRESNRESREAAVRSAAISSDTQAPSAPTNLQITNLGKTSLAFSWTASTDNTGVARYLVYRNGVQIATPSRTRFSQSGLTPNTTYTYTVAAQDTTGNISAPSTPLAITTVPATSLLFKLGDRIVTTSSINVRSGASPARSIRGTQPADAQGKLVSGPTWNNGYWWWNVNFDSGTDGWATENYFMLYTPPVVVTDTQAPSIPTRINALAVSTTAANVTWNASSDNIAVAGYKLYRDGVLAATTLDNQYADSGLVAGNSYIYTVAAFDDAGNLSAPSGGFVLQMPNTTPTDPQPPVTPPPVTITTYPVTVSLSGTGAGTVSGDTISCSTSSVGVCTQNVAAGTSLTLTATPATGSTFGGWSGACSSTSSCIVTPTGTTTVTATFTVIPPSTYSLTVSTTGTGSGTVTGGSISCGATCTQTSPSGTVVTLTAAAASGSTFSGWSGACSGSSPTCNVTLTTNASVIATFTQNVVVTPPPTTPPSTPTPTGVWYAAPNGTAAGAGTLASPWDLKTALAGGNGKIQAGNTLYLRGGTYTGLFTSTLTGTSAAPIVVRSAPGEWAIIDGAPFTDSTQVALLVNGAYTWYRDFEVTNSNTDRPVAFPYRPATVNVYGPNTKFINMLIHDGGQGIGLWDQSASAEVHGNIIYNNGGEARDHGIYTQNNGAGTSKEITNNVIFNSYGYAIHAYGSSANGYPLLGYIINDNTFVNDNSIIGNRPVQNLVFKNNSLYNSSFNFGYFGSNNVNGTIENNWFASPLVEFSGWKNMNVKNNTFWKTGSKAGALMNIFYYTGYALTDYSFTGNKYFQFDPWESIDWGASFPNNGGVAYTFGPGDCCLVSPYPSPKPTGNGTWQGTLGYDKDGTYVQSRDGHPTGTNVLVRPNKYETGRATISVYNWDNKDTVTVDLSGTGLVAGDTYELHNAQNYKAQVLTGQYNGSPITINMKYFNGTTPWSVVAPIGNVPALSDRPLSFPEFGVFVINKKQ